MVMQTNHGKIVIGFLEDKAPLHVANFKKLATDGFYNGLKFHRVIPGFMIQGGCPNTRDGASGMPGTGGPGHNVRAEFNDTPHEKGILSMARSSDPNSAGSQFFIVYGDTTLPPGYTIWGKVTDGLDLVQQIADLGVEGGGSDGPPVQPVVIESASVSTA